MGGWRALVMAATAVVMVSAALAGEIVVEPVARIEQPGKALELIGAARSANGASMLVAVAESESKAGLLAYQIHEANPKAGESRQLFRTELPKDDGRFGFIPRKLRSFARTSDGNLILCGRFDHKSSAIRKVSGSGEVLREVPHPNKGIAKAVSPVVMALLQTEQDELLTISGYTCLYDRDLGQKWQLPSASDQLVLDGMYDTKRQRFVLARLGGKISKFGLPADGKPQTIVMAVGRDGSVAQEISLAGTAPHVLPAGDGLVVLTDTLQEGKEGQEGRFVLTWLDAELKETGHSTLAQMPVPMMPSVYPLRLFVRPDRHVVAVGNPGNKLFAREWDEKGQSVAVQGDLWPTPVGGELWLDVQGDAALVVSGQEEPPVIEDGAILYKQFIRIDRLRFRP